MTQATETTPTSEHQLSSDLLNRRVQVTVVGCGGTGTAVAAGLPYLHQAMVALGHPFGLGVTLVDGDRISRANCIRQPFSISEVGLYKSTVLATRINLFWGLDWRGTPEYLDETWRMDTDILIACVDSRTARHTIASTQAFWNCHYWLDIGNNAASGQFVLGQPKNRHERKNKLRLPTVADLFPEIVDPKLDKKDKLPSCSAVEALRRQEPFVNQTLANLALGMMARLFRYGRLSYHGGFLNFVTGRLASLPVDPAVWQRIREQNQRQCTRAMSARVQGAGAGESRNKKAAGSRRAKASPKSGRRATRSAA
jgi:PRTRC genetic system ThiF family protein